MEPYAVWAGHCALGGDSGGGVLDARGSIIEFERDAVPRMKRGSRFHTRVAGIFARVRLARCLAATLLLLPVLAFGTATAAHAATAAKAGHAVAIRVPLRRPGLYEVRVTVSSRFVRTNRVTLEIGALGGHMSLATVTTSRGQSARISLPVRIPAMSLIVRATGGQSRPTVRVLKWLIAPIHAGLPSATVTPRAPTPPAVGQPQRKPKPKPFARPTAPRRIVRPPSLAVVVKRISKPGVYVVRIGISSRGGRKNRVKLQIGSLARRAVTTGRGHASMFLKVSIARHSLTVRATGDRAQPELTVSMRRISPLEEPAPTITAPPAPVATPVAPAPPAVVPAPSTSVPYSHVVIAVEENYDGATLLGGAPYLAGLAAQGEYFPNYHGVSHPSEPNYMALFSGSTQGTDGSDSCVSSAAESIVGDGAASGVTVKGYIEGLTSGTLYACRHDPFSQFADALGAETDFANFPADYTTLPALSYIVPNTVDDMHDAGIGQGNTWAQTYLDAYAQWAKTHNSLLIVISDENDGDSNYATNQPGENGNTALALAVGAGITPGSVDNTSYDHYSLLRTVEDLFGLGHLGASATAADMIKP